MTKQMMVLIAIFLYIAVCSLFIEPNSLTVNKYQLEDGELGGVRVVFASDFHLSANGYNRLDKIVEIINRQEADIVLLGGDILNGHDRRKTLDVNTAAQKLALIKAKTYAVMGENDYWAAGNDLTTALRYVGIKVLKNSAIRAIAKRRYIDIVGVDDITVQTANMPKAFYGTRAPRILITHNPDIYYDITERVNLIFAGHTHGGQFVFPFSPPLFVPSKYGSQFASGLIKLTANRMIISKGIGTSFMPVRFNCKPEIVVVDFVPPGTGEVVPK